MAKAQTLANGNAEIESPGADFAAAESRPAVMVRRQRLPTACGFVYRAFISSRLFWTRLLAGIAFTASLMMSLDEHRASPAFCRLNEGCDYVTASPYGKPAGIPLADIGVAAFVALFVVSLFPAWKNGRALQIGCIASGLVGGALLLIQGLAIRHFCPFCAVIDGCGVGLLLLNVKSPSPAWQATSNRVRWSWAAALTGAALGCFGFNALAASHPAPDYVRELWQPDKINIISVTDFSCPYCRQIEKMLAEHRDDPELADLHREIIVLPRSYAASQIAALAYFAAQDQGRGDEMAEKLFAAEKISLDLCLLMAADLDLDVDKFFAAMESEELRTRVTEHARRIVAGGIPGLPVTWVNDQQIVGWFNLAALKSAIVRARRAKAP